MSNDVVFSINKLHTHKIEARGKWKTVREKVLKLAKLNYNL